MCSVLVYLARVDFERLELVVALVVSMSFVLVELAGACARL
jgi:hypothetical protein